MNSRILTIFLFCFCFQVQAQSSVDLVIIGGGASGTAAGIAAGREGVSALIIEPTPWLGGMLTSAGVSAIYGNHRLPSWIWGEFSDSLRVRYGSQQALSTGWVSNTLFEPRVGQEILRNMVDAVPGLQIFLQIPLKVDAFLIAAFGSNLPTLRINGTRAVPAHALQSRN